MTDICPFCALQWEREIQPHLLALPPVPAGAGTERSCSAGIATLVWALQPQTGTQAQIGLTGMLLHPPFFRPAAWSRAGRSTPRMERYPWPKRPSDHPPQNLQPPGPATRGRMGTIDGKAGQEGTEERGSFSGKFLQREDVPSLAPRKPCARPANKRAPKHAHAGRRAASPQAGAHQATPGGSTGGTEVSADPIGEPGFVFPRHRGRGRRAGRVRDPLLPRCGSPSSSKPYGDDAGGETRMREATAAEPMILLVRILLIADV